MYTDKCPLASVITGAGLVIDSRCSSLATTGGCVTNILLIAQATVSSTAIPNNPLIDALTVVAPWVFEAAPFSL